jgi:hypothetical protein
VRYIKLGNDAPCLIPSDSPVGVRKIETKMPQTLMASLRSELFDLLGGQIGNPLAACSLSPLIR